MESFEVGAICHYYYLENYLNQFTNKDHSVQFDTRKNL